MTWWNRLRRRGQLEEQLDKELRFHLEECAADLVARHPSRRGAAAGPDGAGRA
jgi:hypothetical protein